MKKKTLEALGDDFEKTASGFVDYLLLYQRKIRGSAFKLLEEAESFASVISN